MIISIPLALEATIFLDQNCHKKAKQIIDSCIELLAAHPFYHIWNAWIIFYILPLIGILSDGIKEKSKYHNSYT